METIKDMHCIEYLNSSIHCHLLAEVKFINNIQVWNQWPHLKCSKKITRIQWKVMSSVQLSVHIEYNMH